MSVVYGYLIISHKRCDSSVLIHITYIRHHGTVQKFMLVISPATIFACPFLLLVSLGNFKYLTWMNSCVLFDEVFKGFNCLSKHVCIVLQKFLLSKMLSFIFLSSIENKHSAVNQRAEILLTSSFLLKEWS